MEIPQAIPFALSAVIMLWALGSAAFAFRGGIHSGLPVIVQPAPAPADGAETEADD